MATEIQICLSVLNLGGGFGIRYTEEDKPLDPSAYVEEMETSYFR